MSDQVTAFRPGDVEKVGIGSLPLRLRLASLILFFFGLLCLVFLGLKMSGPSVIGYLPRVESRFLLPVSLGVGAAGIILGWGLLKKNILLYYLAFANAGLLLGAAILAAGAVLFIAGKLWLDSLAQIRARVPVFYAGKMHHIPVYMYLGGCLLALLALGLCAAWVCHTLKREKIINLYRFDFPRPKRWRFDLKTSASFIIVTLLAAGIGRLANTHLRLAETERRTSVCRDANGEYWAAHCVRLNPKLSYTVIEKLGDSPRGKESILHVQPDGIGIVKIAEHETLYLPTGTRLVFFAGGKLETGENEVPPETLLAYLHSNPETYSLTALLEFTPARDENDQ